MSNATVMAGKHASDARLVSGLEKSLPKTAKPALNKDVRRDRQHSSSGRSPAAASSASSGDDDDEEPFGSPLAVLGLNACQAHKEKGMDAGFCATIDNDETSIEHHYLIPSYCFLLKLFRCSIDDLKRSPTSRRRETAFWHSPLCNFYGGLLCSISALVFGDNISTDDLRRIAEINAKMPRGSLTPPDDKRSFLEVEQDSSRLKEAFRRISVTQGHVEDAASDMMFYENGRR